MRFREAFKSGLCRSAAMLRSHASVGSAMQGTSQQSFRARGAAASEPGNPGMFIVF
jgi:hypothetical protein